MGPDLDLGILLQWAMMKHICWMLFFYGMMSNAEVKISALYGNDLVDKKLS